MKPFKQIISLSLLAALAATTFTGCTSTSTQDGVQIEQSRSWNPLGYIPYL